MVIRTKTYFGRNNHGRVKKGANLFILCSNFRTGKSATFGSFMRREAWQKKQACVIL